MNEPLQQYARMGLVHHMLYGRCVDDPDYHVATLEAFVKRTDIETFDCCLPYGLERQQRLAKSIRASGKEHVAFAAHLFPSRKLSFASTSPSEQAQVRLLAGDLVGQAAAIGASGFIFPSCGPAFAEASEGHHRAFREFCLWLCEKLAAHHIDALLEPFDFDFDKKFLYGPLDRCLELVDSVSREAPNIGIELDMAHLPLMREGYTSAIHRSARWLNRVHLGNCAMRHPSDPFYGDKHPPIGYPGGEIDVPQLVEILGALRDVGFLNMKNRGDLVIEMNPFPHWTEDESVADNMQRVHQAWHQVLPSSAA